MQTASDCIIKNPVCVEGGEPAEKTVDQVLRSEAKAVCLVEKGRMTGLITPLSVIEVISNKRTLEGLKAADLALKEFETVKPESDLASFLPVFKKIGVLAVIDSKETLHGLVTLSSAAALLGAKVEELERELDAVINFTSDEILVADGKGAVLRANAVFEEHFGVSLSSVLGKTVDELEQQKVFFPSVTRLVLDKKSAQTVIQSRRDGRKLLATGTPAFNEDGSIFRVVVNTRDITRLNELKQQLEEAELLKNRYHQELIELRQGYMKRSEIIAVSPAMQELLKIAQKIAAADSTVLLTGESGSGKGMIARYIHTFSPRSDKPFTVVNCGAIPDNLLESELFGYAGGAFTGARREGKIGKLELANKGTLFLDEITELPLNLQVKLLHVIQEGVITRIGGTREINLNLRFIAATNRDIVRLKRSDLEFVVATGYGRISIDFADKRITEITCHGRGAHYWDPMVRTVIDIGGQDSKVIRLNESGRVLDFAMNDKCAAGTGRFLEVMAQALEAELGELAGLSDQAQNTVSISSMCTVFAESEVVSLIAQGLPREDIARGLHQSIADRTAGLVHRVGLAEKVMITGGVAKNGAVVRALNEKLNTTIIVPVEPQIAGALGAAILAGEELAGKS